MDGLLEKVFVILIVIIGIALVGGYGVTQIRSGMEKGEQASAQVEKMSEAMLETEFTKYDATEITGSQVINVIKKYEQEHGEICILVNNGRTETEYVMTQDLSAEAANKAVNAKKKSDLSLYINPSSLFLGEVIREEDTGTITTVKFTKQ